MGPLDDGLDVLQAEHLTGRVAWVDDADGLGLAPLQRGLVGALQLGHVKGPVVALVQVVADLFY